jgi:hypothetical protein
LNGVLDRARVGRATRDEANANQEHQQHVNSYYPEYNAPGGNEFEKFQLKKTSRTTKRKMTRMGSASTMLPPRNKV